MFDLKSLDAMRVFSLALLIAAGFALSACNTVEGAGQDVSAAGNTISDTADDVQDDL